MKLANLGGRATVVTGAGGIDVERASNGRFGPDVQAIYDDWAAFRELAAGFDEANGEIVDETMLRCPVPAPRQVFAIGLNYRAHAEESGMAVPDEPIVFSALRRL